jgi:chemotaxis signal transduction protein
LARKKKVDEKLEAKIKELEEELLALKADYLGAAIDELRLPKGHFTVVTFRLGGKTYALPLWSVRGISRAVTIKDEGELGPGYAGVIDFHGELVPVLDAGATLRTESREMDLGDHVLYFAAAGRRVAMVVEAVIDVATLDGEKIIPAGDAGLPRRPFLGAYDDGGSLIRVLEPATLLPDATAAPEPAEPEVPPDVELAAESAEPEVTPDLELGAESPEPEE